MNILGAFGVMFVCVIQYVIEDQDLLVLYIVITMLGARIAIST